MSSNKDIMYIINKKLFSKINKDFTKDELDYIENVFYNIYEKSKNTFDVCFEIQGYKNLFLNDKYQSGFKNRLLYTYYDSFSEFKIFNEMILSLANNFIKISKKTNHTKLFNALVLIFIKCNLIVKEIECLVENGFPNGAFARWRSLFEYSVIGEFITINGEELAKRYIDFIEVERNKEIENYKKNSNTFNGINEETIKKNNTIINKLKEQYGEIFTKGDYGWANFIFKDRKNCKITFKDILEFTEKKEMILYYKFSCNYIHGNCKNILVNLANIDGLKINIKDYDKVVGNSANIGFSEPIQLTMYFFLNIYICLISTNPVYEDIMKVIYLRNKIKDITLKCIKVENKITENGN